MSIVLPHICKTQRYLDQNITRDMVKFYAVFAEMVVGFSGTEHHDF
jgi:hypothetical protein